uniref:Putative secreted protein n=1 Tax=Anopheles marajoara TaxID=58244 RepID=A0A2M4C8I7_9DIPT
MRKKLPAAAAAAAAWRAGNQAAGRGSPIMNCLITSGGPYYNEAKFLCSERNREFRFGHYSYLNLTLPRARARAKDFSLSLSRSLLCISGTPSSMPRELGMWG